MTIKDIQSHVSDAVARLPDQFIDSSNLINLVSLGAGRMQGINDEAIKMLDGMSLSTAIGKQLDNLATILNLIRIVGESDSDFRARIFSETAVLAKSGEPSHVIDVYLLLTEASSIFFNENYPAGIQLSSHKNEPQNLLKYSEEFDNAAWSGTAGVVSDTDISPDGSLTADTISDNDNLAWRLKIQATIITIDTTKNYTSSIHLKKDTIPRAVRFCAVYIRFSGSTVEDAVIRVDTSTGEYVVSIAGVANVSGNVTDLGDYWGVSITGKSTDILNTLVSCLFYPAFGADNSWAASASTIGSAVVWGAQLTESESLSEYLKTTSEVKLFDSSNDYAIINSMQNVKAGGIDMILVISPETDFFFFDSEANVDASDNGTIDASGGFGSSLDVDGGKLSRVLT